jgi:hypothetical protein
LLAVISIHLAVTLGLHKAFRIEKYLSEAKSIRAEVLAFYSRLSHLPADYLNDHAKEFFKKVEDLERKHAELDAIRFPSVPNE